MLPDGKCDLAGLDGLLQLANMVAGFSPMLLLSMVSAGSYADQVLDEHIHHPQQKVQLIYNHLCQFNVE